MFRTNAHPPCGLRHGRPAPAKDWHVLAVVDLVEQRLLIGVDVHADENRYFDLIGIASPVDGGAKVHCYRSIMS